MTLLIRGSRKTDQADSSVSSIETVSHDFNHSLVDEEHRSGLSPMIERRLQQNRSAYGQAWTKSTIIIMSGPVVSAILRLLPVVRTLLNSDHRDYRPTSDLVASIKFLALLPCFVQQYIYFWLQINRLRGYKRRFFFTFWMVVTIIGAEIVLFYFIDGYYFVVLSCTTAGFVCQGFLVSGEFFRLMMKQLESQKRETMEHN